MKRIIIFSVAIILATCGSAFAESRIMSRADLYKWIAMYSEDIDIARVVLCEKANPEKFAKGDRERIAQALRTGCWSASSLLNNLDLLMKYPDSIAQSIAVLRDISDTLDALSLLVASESDLELRYIERVYYKAHLPHIKFYDHLIALAIEKDRGTRNMVIVR